MNRVGRVDKGGSREASILIGREDEAEVAVLAYSEVTLNLRRVFCQELVGLLDGGLFRLARELGE